jgi:branched-chain amino acid transport system permease protein
MTPATVAPERPAALRWPRGAWPALALVAVLALLPVIGHDGYPLKVATTAIVFGILATSLNLIYGFTGLLSFAQVAFWGLGGYTSALLAVDLGWSPWLGALAGGVLAALVALVVGFAALKLSRHAFAIVTLSFVLLMQLVAKDWVDLTRGPLGIPNLPRLQVAIPGAGTFGSDDPVVFYFIILAFACLALAAVRRLTTSRIGRVLLAIKQNEALAQSQGVDTLRYKLLAFAVSALVAGITGGLFVFYLTVVDPSIFDFYYTQMILIMVIIGGAGSFWGVLAASVVFTILPELFRISPDLRLVFLGAVLVAAVLAFPGGVAGWLRERELERLKKETR